MHRKEQLLKLISEWVDLDLPFTCVSLDTYASMRIERRGNNVYCIRKARGHDEEYGYFVLNQDQSPSELVITRNGIHASVSLILYALEKAIENN